MGSSNGRKHNIVFLGQPQDAAAVDSLLSEHGLNLQLVERLDEVIERVKQDHVGVVVLDEESGIPVHDLLTRVRRHSLVPVAIISDSDCIARVAYLTAGADQVIERPLGESAAARIHSTWRMAHKHVCTTPNGEGDLEFGHLKIVPSQFKVIANGQEVKLSKKEYEILLYLAQRANRLVSADELLRQVWGYHEGVKTRTLNVHIARLRTKLELDPRNPTLIRTVPCRGYMLVSPP